MILMMVKILMNGGVIGVSGGRSTILGEGIKILISLFYDI